MMHTVIVRSHEEGKVAAEEAAKRGLRWACSSNAGLPRGSTRLTFLPESAFLRPGEEPSPSKEPMSIAEWLAELDGD